MLQPLGDHSRGSRARSKSWWIGHGADDSPQALITVAWTKASVCLTWHVGGE
jgi:hypothetical protein